MARIAGVDLPVQKRIWVGLTSIYGIGQPRAKSLCAKANVDHTKKVKDLTEEEINSLRQAIESEGRVEGDLRKEVQMNIRRRSPSTRPSDSIAWRRLLISSSVRSFTFLV